MARDRFLKQSLGTFYSQVAQSRILVVGAGGIGCELLKNLVTTGFGEIHIVDLDTIDLSNLNRQFLFRQAHIKKSKALVAKDTAGPFNPNAKIEAYHANIKDPQFSIDWFKSFAIVFNALDNLDARRYVNKMCIAANIPLIESGTTGFLGQVQPIVPGETQCYDCTPKETPKSFPVCTIRSTPSQPIHCIVWAKSYLFTELFGTSEYESPELDHAVDAENEEEVEALKIETAALNEIRLAMGSQDFARLVFEKVFVNDIIRLRSMDDMWKTRKAPIALQAEDLLTKAMTVEADITSKDQNIWSLEENVAVFTKSIMALGQRLQDQKAQSSDAPIFVFDKDDKDALDFVTSSANLRSIIFGIETKSEFEVKQMAGNIIPAIATTNAITASLCVLQAFKIMQGEYNKAKMIFLSKSTDRTIEKEDLQKPNPECAVCGTAQARLVIDMEQATLQDLVEGILISKLDYTSEISISVDADVVYDPEFDDNLPKKLSELEISNGSFVTILDESDDPRINLVFAIVSSTAATLTNGNNAPSTPISLVPETLTIPKRPATISQEATISTDSVGEAVTSPNDKKRKRESDEASLEMADVRKRGKVAEQIDGDDDEEKDDEKEEEEVMADENGLVIL